MSNTTRDRIYSGLLGKAIGVRLGAPIEPYQWTYDKIRNSYGTITGYVKDSHRFAADDDTNGPAFFIRALIDEPEGELTPQKVGNAWLNYARENQGMFWWGGEGISSEHTAYSHLKNGIPAPDSGSSSRNGKELSEQVGGQIFVDSWGLIHPKDSISAARDARIAASVSHDGEALVGAEFIAGMIAKAFEETRVEDDIMSMFHQLDETSEYIKVARDIVSFYKENPSDFRVAYDYVAQHYSYDHYAGACHIIPNACIVLIGLLYGENDFSRSIEITCMCGWDTDSNAGVVGTILGVKNGIDGIPSKYRDSIQDTIIASSMSPTLNIVNIPDLANLIYNLSLETIEETHNLDLDFSFKGSNGGLKVHNEFRLVHDEITRANMQSADFLIDNLVIGDKASIYYQTFYEMNDFGDNRYDPVFAPLVYSMQTLSISLSSDIYFIDGLYGAPYVSTENGEMYQGEWIHLEDKKIKTLEFTIPDTHGHLVKEVGVQFKTESQPIDGNGLLGRVLVHSFKVQGSSEYEINSNSFNYGFLNNISPFSNQRVQTSIDSNNLRITSELEGIAITGNYFTKDVKLIYDFISFEGDSIVLPFRVKGLDNYYFIRIQSNEVSLERHYNLENHKLKSVTRDTHLFETLQDITLNVIGNDVEFSMEGVKLEWQGIENDWGHFGLGIRAGDLKLSKIYIKTNI